MRGTGYAIGEILIFLAIAAIIGFLIGWLVFYRRPDKGSNQLSPVNPNHVRRLEERSKAVDAKLGRIEKRANALLQLLSKAPRPGRGDQPAGEAADNETSLSATEKAIAPAAASPIAFAQGEDEATDEAAPAEDEAKDADTTPEDETQDAVAATPEDEVQDAEAATSEEATQDDEPSAQEPAEDAQDEGDEAEAAAEEPEAKPEDTATADSTTSDDTAEAGVDEYLSEADDRISKLEETLDKLSEKLAELEDD